MARAYYIPNGPKNLAPLFSDINFDDLAEYFIEVKDSDNNVVATSPLNIIQSCDEDPDLVRIHFLNSLSAIDAINFKKIKVEHAAKADSYETPLTYPLDKTKHGVNRFNVKSGDVITAVTIDYGEDEMEWIDELFDSPVAWMQWKGTQGQPDSYLPIVIMDSNREKQSDGNRFVYQVTLVFKLSNEKINIRN